MEHWDKRPIFGEVVNVGWSREKAARNLGKHGVTFEEAITAFDDPKAVSASLHEGGEPRDRLVGRSFAGRLLSVVVSVSGLGDGSVEEIGFLRVVSARRATPSEEAQYRS